MTHEKSFQNYFLKQAHPAYKMSPDGNPGIPDIEVIRGLYTYRIELKVLKVGPSGNKKLSGIFKPTQPPWYIRFLADGGKGLYICYKLNRGYGLQEVDQEFCLNLKSLYYQDLLTSPKYTEYKTLKDLLKKFNF